MAGLTKKRIQFYHTLATLEEAGVSRLQALRQRFPPPFGGAAKILSRNLRVEGLTLSESMRALPRLFSGMEQSLVAVGERTGSLDLVFRSLSEWFELLANLRSTLVSGLIYPAMTYHFAALAIPFIRVFTDGIPPLRAAAQAGLFLALPWAALILSRTVGRMFHTDLLAGLVLRTPLVGSLVYRLDCTRFFHAYGLSLRAGAHTIQAIDLSAECCVNAVMRKRFHRIGELLQSEGIPFTEAFTAALPAARQSGIILSIMRTGEQTGRTDDSATRIARLFQEETQTVLKRIATILPTLVYLILAGFIAVQIFRFYGKLLAPIQELL